MKKQSKHFEMIVGITIAVSTAIFALNNLIADEFDKAEIILHNEEASALAWYNSKSIKQNMLEGQAHTLESLMISDQLDDNIHKQFALQVEQLRLDIARYEKEKTEILEGSSQIAKEDWAQDIDGVLGQVIGAKQYADMAKEEEQAGNMTDMASLFFELALILGGISLLFDDHKLEVAFYSMLCVFSVVGAFYTLQALSINWPF